MKSQNIKTRQELLKSLSNERVNMITRGAEAKRLLATFVYRGYDDPFAKGRLLETISKCENRIKQIDQEIKDLNKVEL
jgi:hypothetical protein